MFKKDTWYWLGNPNEGDLWIPAYINHDDKVLIDEKEVSIDILNNGLVREAVMPHSLDKGHIILPDALTAENGAKSLLIGEYFVDTTYTCIDLELNVNDCDSCPHEDNCDGGTIYYKEDIPWTTIKEIYKKIVDNLGRLHV
jgi:hypothetical protein